MITRRRFMKTSAAAAAIPMFVNSKAFGANDRIVMGAIGTGGRGTGDMRSLVNSKDIRMVAVCDVVESHCRRAKEYVDKGYGSNDCKQYVDFRDIIVRDDIDAVMIGTPDHWHAVISIMAMKNGKDVFCEKPETLTIGEGRKMLETARRYGRVFAGGSQRVWGDYNWYHKMVQGGRIGEPKECWVNCGGPSGSCYLAPVKTPEEVAWDMWLGPAPVRPFHPQLIRGGFRPFRDYSGGGMTDWGCHTFGGALFTLKLHKTGPVQIIPPDGKDVRHLTYVFENGIRIYHGGGWGGKLSFRGTEGECPDRSGKRQAAPNIHIPNYKGGGLMGDFIHCMKTRELPFRDIEVAHRTASHCHLGNIAYWLRRPLKWDPVKEEIIGDENAARWIDRAKRGPWQI